MPAGDRAMLWVRSFVVQVFLQDVRRLAALVVVAAVLLAAATTLLARFYHGEQAFRARHHLETGRHLMAAGEIPNAVLEFRASLMLSRDDPEPARLLAQALLALGRLEEAHTYLRGLVGRYPVDGSINRDMARVAAATQRTAEARAYYQRAIYGEWPDDPLERRIATRFELVEYLHQADEPRERRAELLLLRGDLPVERVAERRRLAGLLVDVSLVGEAIEVLRDTMVAAPDDAALFAQLADAQTRAGRMTDARATLRLALKLDPGSPELRDELTVVNRVLALDPTLPTLRLVERTRRTRVILAAVVEHISACDVTDEATDAELQARAEPYLRQGIRDAETAEAALRLAGEIWEEVPACRDGTPESIAIARVLQVAAQAQDPIP